MGKFDAHKNFALSSVATAPSPATSGTSLVVTGGTGILFPAVPFNAVIWPTGAKPTSANAEIVRVTNIATDTFTITRAQESTSARTIIVGDQIMDAGTAKVFTDIEALWGFRSVSGTDLDEVLPASTDLVYDDILEVGATVVLELPATSTLEISAHIGQGDTDVYQKVLRDTFMGNAFVSLSGTVRSITLDENKDFTSPEILEVGAGYSFEIPVTSTLEIITYAPTVAGNPIGSMIMFGGNSPPAGYLLCRGQALLRSAYVDLFSVIGVTYGVGDGSTTFNIPDMRQRFPLGLSDSGTGNAMAATGGAVDHTHALSDSAYAQAAVFNSGGNSFIDARVLASVTGFTSTDGLSTAGLRNGIASSKGIPLRGTTDATNPPFLVVNFIIKT